MPQKDRDLLLNLSDDISSEVGNLDDSEINKISKDFSNALNKALAEFNSDIFDNNGYIKKLASIEFPDINDKAVMRNVLNDITANRSDIQSLNQSEMMLRRDLENICTHMPEMRDVIYIIRDAIIECNTATGEVSRSLLFMNSEKNDQYIAQIKEMENKHNLKIAIKNFIVPKTLMIGESYVHVKPLSKIFNELEQAKINKYGKSKSKSNSDASSLMSESNLTLLTEAVSNTSKTDSYAGYVQVSESSTSEQSSSQITKRNAADKITKDGLQYLLENIEVTNHTSMLLKEMGPEALMATIKNTATFSSENSSKSFIKFMESYNDGLLSNLNEVDVKTYDNIKGCYIKYIDSLNLIPIRVGGKIVGYYYTTTSMDARQSNAYPSGVVDVSYNQFTKDSAVIDNLSNIIIRSFDNNMLNNNIKLKDEIAETIMAHKFSKGKLSFVFIPDDEIIRFAINEDENGRGHSVIEPCLFPARCYLILTLYNMLYILNNNVTRIHYLKSSGLNKNYSAQIQRTIRKFQSRRITMDDIYSYQGAMNKIGGLCEMVLPAGKGDYKALETDSIEPVTNPIPLEFLEIKRRETISGTGVPQLMVINAIDEVDFAKTLELANTRYLSTVSSYKIDLNKGLTELYQIITKYETDIPDEFIKAFLFKFDAAKQHDLNITSDMIQNFNTIVDTVASCYYTPSEIEDDNGKPTIKVIQLRKELAKKYLPQLDFDELDDIINNVNTTAIKVQLQDKVIDSNINADDIDKSREV